MAASSSVPGRRGVPIQSASTSPARETSSGSSEEAVMSSISISMAKSIPAIGALKMAATAAEVPQAVSRINDLLFRWNSEPSCEPMAEPVSAIGASNPTDPPNPTVSVLLTSEEYVWCRLM